MTTQTVARKLPVTGTLNAGKTATITGMGKELDRLRFLVWSRFSGAKTAMLSKRKVRDRLMKENSPADFAVPQRLWRATVEDTVDKIRAWQRAVTVTEVRPKIYKKTTDDDEQKRLLTLLKIGEWKKDPWLSRRCRKAFADKTPSPKPTGRIVADNGSYDIRRDEKRQVWLAVMTTKHGQRLRINLGPLPDHLVPTSTVEIRPDKRHGWVVTAAYPAAMVSSTRPKKPNPSAMEGIDAGVTEVFTTAGGKRFGQGQYKIIEANAERDKNRCKSRHKLREVRYKHLAKAEVARHFGDIETARKSEAKARHIERHNLGHTKMSRQRAHDREATKNTVYQAVHDLVDTTDHIAAEDLSGMRGKSKFGKSVSRVYSAWKRSFLADALSSVPSRRGSAVTLVNPAYTSQQVNSCGHLGVRKGKNVHCVTADCPQHGVVYDSEINAARNMLSRATDPDIHLFTPVEEVKKILLERVGTVENCPTTTQDVTPQGDEL